MQGFGAAAVTSVNTTLIRIIYPKAQLGRGMGINATVVAVSSVAGPTLAAGILSVAEWPWLFAVNIPIGLVALWLSRRFLPDNPVRVSARRFDWRDAVMNALTFGLLMASVEGFSHGLDPRLLTLGIAALLIVGFFFIRSQLREPYPILPFDLLRIPIFSVSVITSICSFIAQMLAMVALPFYLQKTFGYTEVHTGLILTAWPAIIMVVAPIAGLLVERIHAGAMGGVGLLIMAAGVVLLAFLPEQPHVADIVWRLLLCGLGFGLFQSPNNSILIASAPPERSGSASGMLATARLTGQTTGAALGSPAVPYRPGKRLPYRPVACRRVCPGRFRRQLLTAIARPAAGPYPKQGKSLNPASDTLFADPPLPFPYTQKREKTTPPASLVPGNKIRKCATNEHINITAFPNTPGHAPH